VLVKKFRGPLALHRKRDEPPVDVPKTNPQTRDGETLRLGGNISLVSELPLLERYGARGIGLYRTEFMFMIRANYPTEEEQYDVFRKVVDACQGASTTIRVLDVGGDKPLQYVDFGHEDNPFLGWRGIRFLLSNPQYFEPHLRAILRTTENGRINILLPMVADVEELLQAKEILKSARESLIRDGVPFNDDFRLGIMLEVPSAVYALPDMLPHIDFVSIGTNDLTQYTFAVDRGNNRVTHWYRQLHPVILGYIRDACDAVNDAPGKSLSICGEVAAMPLAVPLLIGLGLRYLSMNPRKIPQIRSVIESVDLSACEDLAQRALKCTLNSEIQKLMEDFAAEYGLAGNSR
jgi:phosphotransferase system enzyme I (PtsI)